MLDNFSSKAPALPGTPATDKRTCGPTWNGVAFRAFGNLHCNLHLSKISNLQSEADESGVQFPEWTATATGQDRVHAARTGAPADDPKEVDAVLSTCDTNNETTSYLGFQIFQYQSHSKAQLFFKSRPRQRLQQCRSAAVDSRGHGQEEIGMHRSGKFRKAREIQKVRQVRRRAHLQEEAGVDELRDAAPPAAFPAQPQQTQPTQPTPHLAEPLRTARA